MTKLEVQVTVPPQVFQPRSVDSMYRGLILGQAPLIAWGSFVFGARGLLGFLIGALGMLAADFLVTRIRNRALFVPSQSIYLAFCYGLLLPPGANLVAAFLAGFGAALLARWAYGSMSGMWLHPGLLGVVLLGSLSVGFGFLSPVIGPESASWLDASPAQQPLAADRLSVLRAEGLVQTETREILRETQLADYGFDQQITLWLNNNLLNPLGAHLPGGYVAGSTGFVPGFFGGVSAVLMLLISLFLVERRLIHSRIAFWYLSVFSLGIFVFGNMRVGLFEGDVLFHLSFGGPLLVAFWVLSDLTAAPTFKQAQTAYAIGAAVLTLVFRLLGNGQFAAIYAAAIVILFVPVLNRYLRPRRYGRTRRLEV